MPYQFKAHVIIRGQIKCLTGLHIGGTEEGYEIGGMDNPIIKDKVTGYPYIPGSSIKGKLRSMMEWTSGKVEEDGKVHVCVDPECEVCRIFGTSADRRGKEGEAAGPTRLIVRDAFLSKDTLESESYVKGGVFVTEVKTENSLNRITSAANPRPMERVPKGAAFEFEMVYGIYELSKDKDKDKDTTPERNIDIKNLEKVYIALDMLEAGVLGGGGSRGSGQIAFENFTATIKTFDDYQKKASGEEVKWPTVDGRDVKKVIETLQNKLGISEN